MLVVLFVTLVALQPGQIFFCWNSHLKSVFLAQPISLGFTEFSFSLSLCGVDKKERKWERKRDRKSRISQTNWLSQKNDLRWEFQQKKIWLGYKATRVTNNTTNIATFRPVDQVRVGIDFTKISNFIHMKREQMGNLKKLTYLKWHGCVWSYSWLNWQSNLALCWRPNFIFA